MPDTSSSDELFDFKRLSYQDFELLVGALLSQSGSRVIAQSRPGQNAPDFEAVLPNGERMIVEVKHYRQPIPTAIVRKFSGDIARARLQMPSTKGLLVVSGDLSSAARQAIVEEGGVDVWTGDDLRRLLQLFPDVANAAANSAAASQLLQMMTTEAAEPTTSRPLSAQFEDRLDAIKAGKDDWSKFEDWGTEILTEIFQA